MNKDLLNQAVNNITQHQPVSPEIGQRGVDLVNGLFKSLQAAKPAWRQAVNQGEGGMDSIKKAWVKAFFENNINTVEQIRLGMKRARQDPSDFFPSVGKFIQWCQPQPEDFGLPDPDTAYQMACNGSHGPSTTNWVHPGVYHAGRLTGWFELRSQPAEKIRPRFKKNYAYVCEEAMKGRVFEAPRVDSTRLEHHRNGDAVRTEENKASAKKALADLKKIL